MRVKISPTEGEGVAKPATEEIRILKHGGIYAIAGVDVGLTTKYLIENWRRYWRPQPIAKGPINGSNFFYAAEYNSGFHMYIYIHIVSLPLANGLVGPLMNRINVMILMKLSLA